MTPAEDRPYKNTVTVLATMHAKERVIGPILRDELGLIIGLAMGVNTDQFGTFSREVERTGSQLDGKRKPIPTFHGFEVTGDTTGPVQNVGRGENGRGLIRGA